MILGLHKGFLSPWLQRVARAVVFHLFMERGSDFIRRVPPLPTHPSRYSSEYDKHLLPGPAVRCGEIVCGWTKYSPCIISILFRRWNSPNSFCLLVCALRFALSKNEQTARQARNREDHAGACGGLCSTMMKGTLWKSNSTYVGSMERRYCVLVGTLMLDFESADDFLRGAPPKAEGEVIGASAWKGAIAQAEAGARHGWPLATSGVAESCVCFG